MSSQFSLDVPLLCKEAFEDAFLTEDMALLATERVDEGFETEAASIERLNRVLAQSLLLSPVT